MLKQRRRVDVYTPDYALVVRNILSTVKNYLSFWTTLYYSYTYKFIYELIEGKVKENENISFRPNFELKIKLIKDNFALFPLKFYLL